ncbi:hypothetical protein OIU84_022483 [Salix udensis]|uniref:Uncharacterized protein n=1 Tax=Salix udensis TaxID=889485 RepID=A0AAD6PEJ4_9ROSI|nr:hypothetical protein OIU84_022483 [Salix udensis]
MQRLCTKFRSLASISSSHRLLHSSQQFYQQPLHFAAASSKWSRNGSLLNTSSSFNNSASLATISSFFSSVSTLPLCKVYGFLWFCFHMIVLFFYLFIVCMFTDEIPQINVFFLQICTSFYI